MKNFLIALAGFVAGSMLVLPLAAQTGIFDSLFVDTRLTVTGDTVLAADSIQESEIDIDNAPTDDYFLQWDQASGKPQWAEIGFNRGDWSSRGDTFNANCPDTPGDTNAGNGELINFSSSNDPDWPINTATLLTTAEPVLQYDLTFKEIGGFSPHVQLRIGSNTGVETLLADVFIANATFIRATGTSSPQAAGPVSAWIARASLPFSLCTEISSVSRVAA